MAVEATRPWRTGMGLNDIDFPLLSGRTKGSAKPFGHNGRILDHLVDRRELLPWEDEPVLVDRAVDRAEAIVDPFGRHDIIDQDSEADIAELGVGLRQLA